RPSRSIELIMFTAEEPTRFAFGCLGSRVLAGVVTPERLARLRDADGLTLDEARSAAGVEGDVQAARLPAGAYAAFVELHIEQGPLLEAAGLPIGVVTAIAAPATLRVELSGPGGHAGAVLMRDRHDPLVAAADVVRAVDRAARGSGGEDTVGTVGLLTLEPAAVNSIPRHVRMDIDIRDTDEARRDAVLDEVRAAARTAAEEQGAGHSDEVLNRDGPSASDPAVLAALEDAAAAAGLPAMRMVSRAYHDCVFMARVCPTAMVFIPCHEGISHRPDEYSTPGQIADGVRVLAGALHRLAA
ncbi:MAG: hydantoinase/carbamoylase family amidase, partial [Thermoleophilia bacterium]